MNNRATNFIKTFLLALIPSVVLPLAFMWLFSENTTATNRDIFPPLDNPLETIGYIGLILFSLPMWAMLGMFISLHNAGFSIPFWASLPSDIQGTIIIALIVILNVLLWTIPISFFRRKWIEREKSNERIPGVDKGKLIVEGNFDNPLSEFEE